MKITTKAGEKYVLELDFEETAMFQAALFVAAGGPAPNTEQDRRKYYNLCKEMINKSGELVDNMNDPLRRKLVNELNKSLLQDLDNVFRRSNLTMSDVIGDFMKGIESPSNMDKTMTV